MVITEQYHHDIMNIMTKTFSPMTSQLKLKNEAGLKKKNNKNLNFSNVY